MTRNPQLAAIELRRRLFCLSLGLDWSLDTQQEGPPAAARAAQHVPFASALRQVVRHRPRARSLPVSSIVMGSQARLDACGFADAIGTVRYGSTPMAASPYVLLLALATSRGGQLSDEELAASEYVAFAAKMVAVWGDYFGATSMPELLAVARNLVEWALDGAPRVMQESGSRPEDDVLVAAVRGTEVFQVIDGHHRVAAAIADGATEVRVNQTWLAAESPLRRGLAARGQLRGRPRIDQPLEARDLADAIVTTNCPSRVLRMLRLLEAEHPGGGRFLELGCGSGWYLGELKRRGWSVLGVTADPFDQELAEGYRDIAADELVLGESVGVAESLDGRFEAVSCLGLGALAATRGGRDEAIRLARAADRLGATVLFCDDPSPDDAASGAFAETVRSSTGFTRLVACGWTDDPPGAATPSRLLAFAR